MKRTTRTLIASAAVAGLLSGAAIHQGYAADKDTKPGKEAAGKRLPKVHACAGQNACKGLGGCKTAEHTCKGLNDCKGKGGCHITKEDIKNWDKITRKNKAK